MAEGGQSREAVFRQIERSTFERVYRILVRVRLIIAPILLLLVLAVTLIDPAPWRRWVVVLVFLGAIGVFWFELVRIRDRAVGAWTLPVNLAMIAAMQLVVIGVTGALESPVMPVVFAFATISAVALGRSAGLGLIIGLQALGVLVLVTGQVYGFLPDVNLDVFGGGHRAGHNDALLWTSAVFMLAILVVIAVLASTLRGVFNGMVRDALAVREDMLETHAAQARELQALSGEIAHELKNPLASIKGLAALVARDVPDGKASERLGVLQGEVDRMQTILDEFLNFSRPLAPLAFETVDLGGLCEGVARLFEAEAHHRKVTLRVADRGVHGSCDPRKIRQVLINLVGNALDASPPGGQIEMRCEAGADGVSVTVSDEGPGLSEDVRGRAFEPGVTDKASGSGIGLTVARAIARQHGGDLRIEAGAPGCVAILELPEVAR